MNDLPIDRVLSLLSKVKRRQPGQYSACCPAHDDKGPSLSIRETPDGAVLLYCFAGCEVADVVSAIGLELQDLFPPTERPSAAPKRIARLLTTTQALELLDQEARLVAVCAGNLAHGTALTDRDRARLLQAAGRICHLTSEAK